MPAQDSHVCQPDAPPARSEECRQARVRRRIGDHTERGNHRDDLRETQEPFQADDLDGDPPLSEGLEHGSDGGVHTAEHRDLAPCRCLPDVVDLCEEELDLFVLGVELGSFHGPDGFSLGRLQLQGGRVGVGCYLRTFLPLHHHGDNRIAHVEDALAGATVDGQCVLLGFPVREIPTEIEDVLGRGAPPAIDGLVRITDGSDRVVFEEAGEQLGLSRGGVLIFVEQDHLVAASHRLPDAGHRAHQVLGGPQLVPEFDDSPLLFELLISVDEGEQFLPLLAGCDCLQHAGIRGVGLALPRGARESCPCFDVESLS